MICTELLRSPYVGEPEAKAIEAQLQTRLGYDNQTGVEQYCFVSGSLPGSWSTQVAVNVKRSTWVPYDDVRHPKTGKAPALVPTLPYVTLEASVHKQMMGHNVHGGPLCPIESALWFVADVSDRLAVCLPAADRWYFERVDIAEVYDLGSLEAVLEYQRGLALCRFPRREPYRFADETIMFAGSTTTWKSYSKGMEFSKHDNKRVAAACGKDKAEELQHLANRLLRVEVSVKSRLLGEKSGHSGGTIGSNAIDRTWLEEVHDRETLRILREAKGEMNIVRNHDDVKRRLFAVYDQRLARVLYGTWSDLAQSGEEYVRLFMPAPTFRRHRKQLEEAGVAWLGSDVFVREGVSLIPVGFSPVRSDARRLVGESSEVIEALASYRRAA